MNKVMFEVMRYFGLSKSSRKNSLLTLIYDNRFINDIQFVRFI